MESTNAKRCRIDKASVTTLEHHDALRTSLLLDTYVLSNPDRRQLAAYKWSFWMFRIQSDKLDKYPDMTTRIAENQIKVAKFANEMRR